MKTLFLASNVASVIFDIFINTPAEVYDTEKPWLKEDRESLKKAGFDPFDYTITDKNEKQLRKDLSNCDYIFVSGGNTFYCLEKAKKSGFVDVIKDLVLKQNKVYIGSSAGSIIAAPDITPAENIDDITKAPNLKDYKGFNLIDVVVLPHWGSERFKELYMKTRLEKSYNIDNKIILLTDNQYLYVKDDWYQIVEP
jgi:dipeptidase E